MVDKRRLVGAQLVEMKYAGTVFKAVCFKVDAIATAAVGVGVISNLDASAPSPTSVEDHHVSMTTSQQSRVVTIFAANWGLL